MPLNEQVEGTVLVVAAACVFAIVAVVVKTDPLPVLWATELRFLVSWMVSIVFMLLFKKSRGLHWFGPPDSRKWLFLKCALSFSFITCWWTGLRQAPVGNCIAIIYTSPILTSILARILMKEPLGVQYPFQVILVVIGSVLILDPPFISASIHPGEMPQKTSADYTFVFMALSVCAFLPLVTKQTRDCSWIEVEHVSAFLAATVLDPTLLLGEALLTGEVQTGADNWKGSFKEGVMIVLAAGGAFVGIAMETKGYQLAQVGKASMFRYVEVPFAYFLQSSFTNEPVTGRAFLGAICIVLSCFLGIEWTKDAQKMDPVEEETEHSQLRAPLNVGSGASAAVPQVTK